VPLKAWIEAVVLLAVLFAVALWLLLDVLPVLP
jgi:hypothetical protein